VTVSEESLQSSVAELHPVPDAADAEQPVTPANTSAGFPYAVRQTVSWLWRSANRLRRTANWLWLWRGGYRLWRGGYRRCYITGIQTVRFCRYAGKRTGRFLRPVLRVAGKILDWLLLNHLRGIRREFRRIRDGFTAARLRIRNASRRNILLGLLALLQLPFLAVRRHWRSAGAILNLLAPVAATFALVTVIQYWQGVTFALHIEYEGEKLGFISNESVFDAAAELAAGRVINVDDSFHVARTPRLSLEIVQEDKILTDEMLCDEILNTYGDQIARVSGLYIDGVFEGAVSSRWELDKMLSSILDSYKIGAENEIVSFHRDVKVVDGQYPVSAVKSAEDLYKELTYTTMGKSTYTVVDGDTPIGIAAKNNMTLEQLEQLNPDLYSLMRTDKEILIAHAKHYLPVSVSRRVTYTEPIPYNSITENNPSAYTGESSIKTQGVEGERTIVDDVILVDEEEVQRVNISKTETTPPVTQVILIGTKVRPKPTPAPAPPAVIGPSGDGKATGRFTWPCPAVTRVYQGYRGGHRAWDFSSGSVPIFNQPVVAADGGVVIRANYYGGYGNCVIIDHGGGLQTLYAHLNSFSIAAGQQVSQGQQIGRVGRTGNSSGAHLHFEVRLNGNSVNPGNYSYY